MISFLFTPESGADIVRYVVAMLGIFLTGANFSIIVHARHLFPDAAVSFWRVFFFGKAMSSVILVLILYGRHGDISWRTIGSAIAFVCVLFALLMIWRQRPYKYVVVRPELLSTEERAEVLENLDVYDAEGHVKLPPKEEPK